MDFLYLALALLFWLALVGLSYGLVRLGGPKQ